MCFYFFFHGCGSFFFFLFLFLTCRVWMQGVVAVAMGFLSLSLFDLYALLWEWGAAEEAHSVLFLLGWFGESGTSMLWSGTSML